MKILLIAGHGAGDPGATGTYGGKVYKEADETRNLVSLIAAELRKTTAEVEIRDTTRNANDDWKAGKLTFPQGLNYVLEIHFNAISQSASDGKTKGVECYVTTSENGIAVEEGICKAVASLGLTNRGVKRKNFNVIAAAKKAGISSALLETCFIDDPDDMAVYLRSRETVAKQIAGAVCEGFGLDWKEDTTMTEKDKPSSWAKTSCDKAVSRGIFQGDENGDMMWQQPVTREQLAVILDRIDLL